MTDKKNYPEEIYKDIETGDAYVILRVRKALEKAYDRGYADGLKAQRDLTGWSNLTAAIKAGERINWDALDGLEAQCVHPELGTLTHRLERNTQWSKHTSIGWHHNKEATWAAALNHAWGDKGRWALYIKGDLPLRKQTADELKPGTCFHARYQMGVSTYTYTMAQVVQIGDKTQVACFSGSAPVVIIWRDPADIEVLEVYGVGTFQTPKENQK